METKKKALYKTALDLFAERGLEGTPTSMIAKEAGVANGTLFHHFKSKEELINQLFIKIKEHLSQDLKAGLPDTQDLKKKIEIIWTNKVNWGILNPKEFTFFRLFYHSLYFNKMTKEEGLKHVDFILDVFQEAFDKKILKGMEKEYARDYFEGNTHINIRYFLDYPEKISKENLDSAFEIFWGGFGTN